MQLQMRLESIRDEGFGEKSPLRTWFHEQTLACLGISRPLAGLLTFEEREKAVICCCHCTMRMFRTLLSEHESGNLPPS